MRTYKPTIWQHLLSFIVILVVALFSLNEIGQFEKIGGGASNETQVSTSESTFTYDDAERLDQIQGSSTSETPEEHKKRINEMIKIHKTMHPESDSQRDQTDTTEMSAEVKQDLVKTIMPYLVVLVGISLFLLIVIILKLRQPFALQIREEGVAVKSWVFGSVQNIPYSQINTIRYQIKHIYSSGANGRSYFNKTRILTFEDSQVFVLGRIRLETASGADFNDIHQMISNLAPDIKWIYPE